jgi:hypothetical protein
MTTSSEGEGRIRGVWPDPTVNIVARTRLIALAYRKEAKRQQEGRRALQELLATVDLRVLEFSDADLAAKIRTMIADIGGDPVRDLDVKHCDYGEEWVLDGDDPPVFEYDDTDWVPASIAGPLIGMTQNHFGQLRIHGHLKKFKHLSQPTGYVYQVGEARASKGLLPGRANAYRNRGNPMFPRRAPQKSKKKKTDDK